MERSADVAGWAPASRPLTAPAGRRPARRDSEKIFADAVRQHLAGDTDAALKGYEDALQERPDFPEALNNAGAILASRRDDDNAIALLRRSVELRPNYGDAHRNLGIALAQSGNVDDACVSLNHAVETEPARSTWWMDLGNALMAAQRFDEALLAYDRALVLSPDDAAAHANRGAALRGLRRHPEAIDACKKALAYRPDHADALLNLGVILKEVRAFDEARDVIERAISLDPNAVGPRVNLAVMLMELNQHAQAEAIGDALTREFPGDAAGWNVVGNCAFEAGDWDRAERSHRNALECDPTDRNAHWNLSVITLLRGDLARGFELFESRKRLVSVVFTRREFAQPEWGGSQLHGRTILIHVEQGAGDVVQFVRYASVLKKEKGAGRVVVECPSSVASLVRCAGGVDEVIERGHALPAFDVHAYMMSLPLLCGTARDSVPATVPYITAPQRPVRDVIRTGASGLRVGLQWAGNALHQRDRIRSIPFEMMAPLLRGAGAGVQFFSLQKDARAESAPDLEAAGVIDLAPHLDDFADTAAAIDEMDLVITVDTSIAHIAGALGKDVWVLLPTVPDWRWMLDRADSPWYPSMRLIRQTTRGDWSGPIAAATQALASHAGNAGEISGEASPSVRPSIVIGWQVGLTSGWGTYGLNLAVALARSSRAEAVLSGPPVLDDAPPLARHVLRSLRVGKADRGVNLVGLGNGLRGDDRLVQGQRGRPVGVVFFEDTALDAAALGRARAYDMIIAGSTWNTEYLRAMGIDNVRLVLQGVDHSVFHPAPRAGTLSDRFVVFSGGKLEYRKGQDIVVEAFRRFYATHRDALLITAWHNHWPQTMAGIDRMGYVQGCPAVDGGRLHVAEWLVSNRLPAGAFIDIGAQPQASIAQVLREVDVAVFPNRCEGGTNLVAMEAMASGVPTILSANSGHLNLITEDTCFALERQRPVAAIPGMYAGTDFWGESDPDEILAHLESAYADRDDARRRGAAGAQLMSQLPWSKQADLLLDALGL